MTVSDLVPGSIWRFVLHGLNLYAEQRVEGIRGDLVAYTTRRTDFNGGRLHDFENLHCLSIEQFTTTRYCAYVPDTPYTTVYDVDAMFDRAAERRADNPVFTGPWTAGTTTGTGTINTYATTITT